MDDKPESETEKKEEKTDDEKEETSDEKEEESSETEEKGSTEEKSDESTKLEEKEGESKSDDEKPDSDSEPTDLFATESGDSKEEPVESTDEEKPKKDVKTDDTTEKEEEKEDIDDTKSDEDKKDTDDTKSKEAKKEKPVEKESTGDIFSKSDTKPDDVKPSDVKLKTSTKKTEKITDKTINKKTGLPTWWDNIQESILIFGLPKHGKTWAYCSVLEEMIKRGGRVFIISTDSGFVRTAKAYFKDKLKDIHDKIDMELVYNINGMRSYYKDLEDDLEPNDILVLDLISDAWEWAQIDFVDKLSYGDIEGFITNSMVDVSKFGLFNDSKWQYIKALHKFVEDIVIRKPCHFVGVANEKDIDVEVIKGGAKTKKMISDLGLDDLGVRPGGFKLLPYKFETLLRIGCEDQRYYLQVVGDRGNNKDLTRQFYGRNMYKKLLEWRNKQE